MTRSSEDIEREVEATRGELDRTVEALKERMSAGQIIDELMGSMKGSGASEMVSNLGRQAKDNPLPLALIGAGVAWLMFGKPPAQRDWRERRSFVADPYTGEVGFEGDATVYDTDASRYHEDYDPLTGADLSSEGKGPGLKDKAAQAAAKAKAAASNAAHKVTDAAHSGKAKASQAVSGARDKASQRLSSAKARTGDGYHRAGERLSSARERARAQAGQYGQRAQRTFLETMENEPLIIAAAGVAIGAAIGAALPASRIENRAVGRFRDKALDQGKAMAQQRMDEAKTIAQSALGAVKEEADRQGLPTQPDALADRVQEVARAGLDTAKREMEQRRAH
ncbi:DUF3618 domain-containing protein [Phenylobacterium terrae]|uniref:DUF3618 domain-containing protein n=1 Tax=Phenylobacterium terrae TaxID=2665495 RepID=A0ABW4MY84_9CAUL